MVEKHVGDAVRLEPDGDKFVLRLGDDSRKRYRLSRHEVHILLADIKNALLEDGASEAEIFYLPYTDMRSG